MAALHQRAAHHLDQDRITHLSCRSRTPCHSSGRNHLYSTVMSVASPAPTSPPPPTAAERPDLDFPGAVPASGRSARSARSPIAAARRTGASGTATSASLLGDAASHPEARILVMSGRTARLEGRVAVHSWVVIKRENAATWSRYDVVGWGNPVRLNWWPPDGCWFGEHGRGRRRSQGRARPRR